MRSLHIVDNSRLSKLQDHDWEKVRYGVVDSLAFLFEVLYASFENGQYTHMRHSRRDDIGPPMKNHYDLPSIGFVCGDKTATISPPAFLTLRKSQTHIAYVLHMITREFVLRNLKYGWH